MANPDKTKLLERRREVANYALQGWTQAAIARQMCIPPCTVSRDLAAMRESWREYSIFDFDKILLEQLQKIDLVETEAWGAWQRSKEAQRSATLTRGKGGEQSRTSLKPQNGDSRFLQEVQRCVTQRCKLIGVKPPEPPAPPQPEREGIEIPKDIQPHFFRNYLLLRDLYGDPPYAEVDGLTKELIAAIVAQYEREKKMSEANGDMNWRKPR